MPEVKGTAYRSLDSDSSIFGQLSLPQRRTACRGYRYCDAVTLAQSVASTMGGPYELYIAPPSRVEEYRGR